MGSLGDVLGGNLALMPPRRRRRARARRRHQALNLLLLGENYARTMGLNVQHTRTLLFLLAVLCWPVPSPPSAAP